MSRIDEVITYDEPFGLTVPTTCPGCGCHSSPPTDLPSSLCHGPDLAKRFRDNFAKYAANVEPEVLATQTAMKRFFLIFFKFSGEVAGDRFQGLGKRGDSSR
jgi:hypothetical protein